VTETAAGKTVRCKRCGERFEVPALDAGDDDALIGGLVDDEDAVGAQCAEEGSAETFHALPRRQVQRRSSKAGGKSSASFLTRIPKWLLICAGGVVAILFVCCGGVFFVAQRFAPPPASAQAGEPFPISSIAIPAFPELGTPQLVPQTEVALYSVEFGTANRGTSQPASLMRLRLYLPPGDHASKSLGCVLVGPAGTNLLTGNDVDDPNYHSEALPYALAGYAVVVYSLDGALPPGSDGSNDNDLRNAYRGFSAAYAGLANSRAAMEFVLSKVAHVDPQRIFAAGHSSAGTLSILFAEHEPRLKGCIAYAPCVDVEDRVGMITRIPGVDTQLPGIVDFVKRSSPKTHVARLSCPLFLFGALDDTNVGIDSLRRFSDQLKGLNRTVEFQTVPAGGHYESMVNPGISLAIQWLRRLPGE
jgi:dienelactone hydrolase